jgi:hypothetical protein
MVKTRKRTKRGAYKMLGNTRGSRKWLALAVVLFAASLAVVNATVFAYRYLQGNVEVVASTGLTNETAAQLGAGCTGFYILGTASGDTITNSSVLPEGGTNYDNQINTGTDWLGIKVDFTGIPASCSWSDGTGTNTLYSGAKVYLNVSQGTWYVKDFLAFGYPLLDPAVQPAPIYVTIKPTTVLSDPNIAAAQLLVYDADTGALLATIDLTSSTSSAQIQLSPGQGVQLDLKVTATGTVTGASFEVGFYVATTSEAPR